MIINHNLNSMNAHRNMSFNTAQTGKSMEKLSSGLRINRAGDDAAGLAISEKMRGQIRGLDQATRNSQDGISMIQTAEGALNETHSILQRMRELGVQASNDTNVGVDRAEIQKEINQLSSEINRVGNTTEFNTQSLLKGQSKEVLTKTGIDFSTITTETAGTDVVNNQVKAVIDLGAGVADGHTLAVNLNGKSFTVTFGDAGGTAAAGDASARTASGVTIDLGGAANTVSDVNVSESLAKELQTFIDNDAQLKDNYKVSITGGNVTIEAVKGGEYEGSKGSMAITASDDTAVTTTMNTVAYDEDSTVVTGSTVAATSATKSIDLAGTTAADLIGKGLTIGDQQVEFYDASKGAYSGKAIGVDVGGAASEADIVNAIVAQTDGKFKDVTLARATANDNLVISSVETGAKASVEFADGGINKNFEASFQVGANKGQSMTIEIADMRSEALGITGKAGAEGFTAGSVVTDGTDNQVKEAALDVSTAAKASSAVEVINKAIETVSAQRSNLGSFQNRLEHTINNLSTSAENLQAAESRIRDVDMAKEMMNFTKNNILNQAAQAMMSQANQQPQAVLQLLR
ncbi:flagellin protein [Exiguobacterium sp. SH3S2]|uniref:flagellin N-terminal helical domain-containing protein n=1 Tax=unclassified Exiguobacterium TaxID=2644629 RepID=UPI00103F0030|nr:MULTISPECIES: flagellin [unclassified Exiguobacterium]TCI41552.1 flagellin protein [Exiguobacterium sp. SH3S3]TCI58190.1 flagellin protein [Exiguobacterium sp. SH3S2]